MTSRLRLTDKGRAEIARQDAVARKLGIDPDGLWRPERRDDLLRIMAELRKTPSPTGGPL
jgi:hypothetical protein